VEKKNNLCKVNNNNNNNIIIIIIIIIIVEFYRESFGTKTRSLANFLGHDHKRDLEPNEI